MDDDLFDTLTRHQIFIQRLAGGQVNKAGVELEKLIAEVERKLEGDLTDFQQFRYQRILNDLKLYAAEVYQEIGASTCLLYTSPSPRDGLLSRMPSAA